MFSLTAKKVFRWLLVLIWLAFTIFLSRQNGASSSTLSGGVATGLSGFLAKIGIKVNYYSFHAFLRQMAHFGIHLVLAILFYRALVLVCGGFKTSICLSLLFCGLVALYDEYVQYYRPGRVFDLEDIALNLLGVSLGVILGILSVKQNE